MEIERISVRNFMSIGVADLGLTDRGLVLIQGENMDDTSAKSNGSGKSSIPDALSWCLFGETARGESGDAIVNKTAGKDTMVEVLLRDGERSFLIQRFRKDSKYKNRLVLTETTGDDERDMTGGTDKLTQETVEMILGCSADVFNSAIYAGQERMPNLPAMTDKQLKELIEEAAGITEIQGFHAEARTRLRDKQTAYEKTVSLLEMTIRNRDGRASDLAEVTAKMEASDVAKAARIEEATAKMLAISKANVGVAEKLRDLVDEHATAVNKVGLLKRSLAEPDLDAERLSLDLRTVERGLAKLEGTLKAEGAEIMKGKKELENLDALVGTNCGECGKEYDAHDLEGAREARRAGLSERVARYKGQQKAVSEAKAERDKREAELSAHVAAHSKKDMTDALTKAIDAVDGFRIEIDRLKAVVKARDDLAVEIKRIGETANPYSEMVERYSKDLTKLESQVTELMKREADESAAFNLHKQAVEVFGPAGVRAHILDHVTPYLNGKTAHYLSVLSDGNLTAIWSTLSSTAKGELREKFVIEVNNDKGGSSFGLLSGGEKRKVRLACSLALQDLVANRATKPFKLYVADEIDDALDSAGLERLMTLLDEKARERGTVLVISHNSLSDWIRESITVCKKDGQSTINGDALSV